MGMRYRCSSPSPFRNSGLTTAGAALALVIASCGSLDPARTADPEVSPTVATTTHSAPPPSTVAVSTTTEAKLDDSVPRYGGVVTIADDQFPPVLNPFAEGGDNFIVTIVGQAHLARGWDVDAATRELIPDALASLPTVDNGGVEITESGGMSVTWELRPEAQWSDGIAMSGADLALSFEAGQGCRPSDETAGFTIDAVGERTLTVVAEQASMQYELLLEWLLPSHAIGGSDPCTVDVAQLPTGGPFRVTAWENHDFVQLNRNPNYWKTDTAGNQLPYLDGVRFEFIPETDEIVRAFKARQVDVIQPPPSALTIEALRSNEPNAVVEVLRGPVWEHINFQFGPDNRNPESLNHIVEYRQAVAHGIDRQAVLDQAGGEGILQVLNGILTVYTPAATAEPWAQYEHDPQRARELLAVACQEAGRDCVQQPPKLTFSTTSNADFRPRVANLLVEQLAPIGIEVELQLEDSEIFFGETLDDGTWDVGQWAWVGSPGMGALAGMFELFAPDRPPPVAPEGGSARWANYYRWGTPGSGLETDPTVLEYLEFLDRIRSTASHAELLTLAGEAEQLLADRAVILPLNARVTVGAYWADEMRGFAMNPTQSGHTWNIEYWYRI